MLKKNTFKNNIEILNNSKNYIKYIHIVAAGLLFFYPFLSFEYENCDIFVILFTLGLQLKYLIFLFKYKKINFLNFHFLINNSFVYIMCIYRVIDQVDLFFFISFCFNSLFIVFSILYPIEDSSCDELRRIKVTDDQKKMNSFFEIKYVNIITYFILKNFNKFLIVSYYIGAIYFYANNSMKGIVLISLFTISFNKGICFLSKYSKVLNNLILQTSYCCSGSKNSDLLLKLAGMATVSGLILDRNRNSQLAKVDAASQQRMIDYWLKKDQISPENRFYVSVQAVGEFTRSSYES